MTGRRWEGGKVGRWEGGVMLKSACVCRGGVAERGGVSV